MSGEKIKPYFEADHDRLDGLFRKFQDLKRPDFRAARDRFVEFKQGLQRHIIWEEEILFPLFEQKTGITEGPTRVMRMEHRQIRDHLEAILRKVQDGNPETDAAEQSLLSILALHNQKEERVLYPAMDQVLTDEDRAAVFETMKAVPKERYEG